MKNGNYCTEHYKMVWQMIFIKLQSSFEVFVVFIYNLFIEDISVYIYNYPEHKNITINTTLKNFLLLNL